MTNRLFLAAPAASAASQPQVNKSKSRRCAGRAARRAGNRERGWCMTPRQTAGWSRARVLPQTEWRERTGEEG